MSTNAPAPGLELQTNEHPQMRPLVVGSSFGWMHTPAGGSSEVAVLLCAPLGHEALPAHRTMRLLADRLASAGYATLRFDYPGCGNSLEPSVPLPTALLAAVRAASDQLRALSGAGRIMVCGLRAGALLGVAAMAGGAETAGFILLAPVVSGRSLAREWRTAAKLAGMPADAAVLETGGLCISRGLLDQLLAFDLRHAALRPGQTALLLPSGPSAAITACIEDWTALGVDVDCQAFEGYAAMMRNSYDNEAPLADIDRVISWLQARHPARPTRICQDVGPPPVLRDEVWEEQPLRFGSDGALNGILCRPSDHVMPDRVVIISNTGGDPQPGFGRFGVVLARRLAAAGIASARIDFARLGNSSQAGEAPSHTYETSRLGDIQAAMVVLAGLGYRRFVLQGICSGAYHAFHAALADPRIEQVILVNQVLFHWRPGDDLQRMMIVQARTPAVYWRALGKAKAWRDLLRGSTAWSVMYAQLAAVARQAWQVLAALFHPAPPGGRPYDALETLSRRGQQVFVLLAAGDLSVPVWEAALVPQRRNRASLPGFTLQIEPGLDHVLTTERMRRTVAEILVTALLADRGTGVVDADLEAFRRSCEASVSSSR